MTVTIFTDGACSGNPGPGGWGCVVIDDNDHCYSLSGGAAATTNNRMEMLAVIAALESLPYASTVVVHTDSKYVINGITMWVDGWIARGWRTASGQDVKNADMWKRMLSSVQRHHQVQWRWVKGHSGNPLNERADQLARDAVPRK